jgi:hypothetical protein
MREADEELLLTNVTMQPQAIALDAINVAAQRPPPGDARAGEQSTELSQDLLNRLPLPDLDPNTVALLAAGVVGTALDSISGQDGLLGGRHERPAEPGHARRRGAGQGGMGVPEEGMRRTSITTSTFDASRGGFAGGMVSMQTARGNNRRAARCLPPGQRRAAEHGVGHDERVLAAQIGGSYGGPIISNKLFYNTSLQLSRNTNHRFALAATTRWPRSGRAWHRTRSRGSSTSWTRLRLPGLRPDRPYNQVTDDVRLQGRVDWNIVQGRRASQTLSCASTRT